ncbi:hypothetical protein CA267_002135 [Alteromonas pelagimontana]|uniref:Uncharacterized protein n=1 Tax=Alteromonas pelagimontana TaxID=1858656 RepID=A0A6M4M940_9ALTE|nr:hypothetical protein [Alteromonas pelagimontana]QJR79682.1 hypothetical protein CA267_002135 [Alteromonas pelagimontana]
MVVIIFAGSITHLSNRNTEETVGRTITIALPFNDVDTSIPLITPERPHTR